MTGSARGQSVIRVISGKTALNHRNPNWVLGSWWGCLLFSPSPGGRWDLKDSPNSARGGLLAASLSLKHG